MIAVVAWALLIWLVILLAFGPEAFKAIADKRARRGRPSPACPDRARRGLR